MQTGGSRKDLGGGVYLVQPNVSNEEIRVTTKTSLLSGLQNDHKGQATGINISIRVIVARSGFPAEIFLPFIVVVCIVAGLYAVLFSASFPSSITSWTQLASQVTRTPCCFPL